MSVRAAWGMCCPRCGADDELFVGVTVWAELLTAGVAIDGESTPDWSDRSPCRCNAPSCGWAGIVEDAERAARAGIERRG